MSRLLLTSFRQPGRNLRDDQLFKQGALASKLVTVDRTNEIWPIPNQLAASATQAGIHLVGASDDDRLLGFLGLSESKGAGWKRILASHKTKLQQLLASLYAQPVDCWVVGGHHHQAPDAYKAMVWGTDYHLSQIYRPYVGFGVERTNSTFEWFGFQETAPKPIEFPISNAAPALGHVSLLAVHGCNGVPWKLDQTVVFGEMAQAWRALTGNALILGWYGVHGAPLDSLNRHAADRFWQALAALKTAHGIADGGLATLVANHPDDVIQAWGKACYDAFSGQAQGDLWREVVKGTGGTVTRGCGAVRPDGQVFHANKDYRPNGIQPAMIPIQGLVIP